MDQSRTRVHIYTEHTHSQRSAIPRSVQSSEKVNRDFWWRKAAGVLAVLTVVWIRAHYRPGIFMKVPWHRRRSRANDQSEFAPVEKGNASLRISYCLAWPATFRSRVFHTGILGFAQLSRFRDVEDVRGLGAQRGTMHAHTLWTRHDARVLIPHR